MIRKIFCSLKQASAFRPKLRGWSLCRARSVTSTVLEKKDREKAHRTEAEFCFDANTYKRNTQKKKLLKDEVTEIRFWKPENKRAGTHYISKGEKKVVSQIQLKSKLKWINKL